MSVQLQGWESAAWELSIQLLNGRHTLRLVPVTGGDTKSGNLKHGPHHYWEEKNHMPVASLKPSRTHPSRLILAKILGYLG